MDTLLLREKSTLPLSDANSKSVTQITTQTQISSFTITILSQSASNPYTAVMSSSRPKRRKKKRRVSNRKFIVEESDSDCLPHPNSVQQRRFNPEMDPSQWDPSPKKQQRQPNKMFITSNKILAPSQSNYTPFVFVLEDE